MADSWGCGLLLPFNDDFFWAQGGNVGLELRW
jgi:hypothetical protein